VLCPSNTFMATPNAAISAGANVVFVDCNREDPACRSMTFSRRSKSTTREP
jgi:dTDP-4-amino-4,6-dideoxygalactose transaminase